VAATPPAGDTTPPQLAGDRADAIAHDVMLHRPQKPVPPQAGFHLLTAKHRLGGLLDRSVHGVENSEVGRVIDVMIGDDGKPAALELDVGGFMGVGNRKIAVAWGLFDLSKPEGTDPLRVALTEAQVKSAPAAEESGQVTIVTGADLATAPAAAKPAGPVLPAVRSPPNAVSSPADGSTIVAPAQPAVPAQPAIPAQPKAPATAPAQESSAAKPGPAAVSSPVDGSAIMKPAQPATATAPEPAPPAGDGSGNHAAPQVVETSPPGGTEGAGNAMPPDALLRAKPGVTPPPPAVARPNSPREPHPAARHDGHPDDSEASRSTAAPAAASPSPDGRP
jgi:hypothetical protein